MPSTAVVVRRVAASAAYIVSGGYLQQQPRRAQCTHAHAGVQRRELVLAGGHVAHLGVEIRQEQPDEVNLVPAAELVKRCEAEEVGAVGGDLARLEQPLHLYRVARVLNELAQRGLASAPGVLPGGLLPGEVVRRSSWGISFASGWRGCFHRRRACRRRACRCTSCRSGRPGRCGAFDEREDLLE